MARAQKMFECSACGAQSPKWLGRCTECGDARWCLFTTADPTSPCELCGGEMKVERRTPGAGPRQLLRERRNAGPGVTPGSRRSPLVG